MTVAQNESLPIPAPWMIMKTEDGTTFIHLHDTNCDRIESCSNKPIRSYNLPVLFPSCLKSNNKQTKPNKTNLHTTISPENPVTGWLSEAAEFSLLSTAESISERIK